MTTLNDVTARGVKQTTAAASLSRWQTAVRFRDSISLQRTVQAEMYPERAG
jgi:hypothetical protein